MEKGQHRFTKIIINMEGLIKLQIERWRCLNFWSLEERRNRQDL